MNLGCHPNRDAHVAGFPDVWSVMNGVNAAMHKLHAAVTVAVAFVAFLPTVVLLLDDARTHGYMRRLMAMGCPAIFGQIGNVCGWTAA